MSANVAILSAALTVIGLVLAIFGASWLNQRATEKLIEQLNKQLDARFASIETRFESRFELILTEIKRLDQRIDAVERRLDRIERQLEALFKPTLPPG
jgi:septal ring factor EnvC (AmiA/AmiB activator)